MNQIVRVEPAAVECEIDVEKLKPGECGILTHRPHEHYGPCVGHPVIKAGAEIAFPQTGNWNGNAKGYRCRRLRPGERVIFEGQ